PAVWQTSLDGQPAVPLQTMHAPKPASPAESHTGDAAKQPGATPPSVDGRQLSHWPLPELAEVSQMVPPVQPAAALPTRQRPWAWLQMGWSEVQPGAIPPSVEATQARQMPPVTVVSQTRPFPHPLRVVQTSHTPLPEAPAGSHAGLVPVQPGSTPPSAD